MSHRLGSLIPLGSPIAIGPATGPPTTPPDTWAAAFPVDPLAKFVILHFNGSALGAADRIEIDLGYDMDRYDASWGPDYWSRPIKGGAPVNIRYIRGGGGSGSVTLDQYARGEALIGDGSTEANGDVFQIDSPFADPTYQYAGGKFPPGSAPTWERIACLPSGIQKDTAASVGMYIVVDGDHLSSCTATLIAPDLLITAGHCLATDVETRTGSVTFDFETKCDGTRPAPYNPKFYKLKRVVRQGYQRAPGDLRAPLDYAVLQFVTPPGGLGLPPIALRPTLPPVGEHLFIIHHPRGAPKKISRFPADTECAVLAGSDANRINFKCDIDNGSSGSSIFDSSGKIVANLSWWDWGTSVLAVGSELALEPPPSKDVDVVLIIDRSGSMTAPSFNSTFTKLQDAKQAASLFISLLRITAGHRAGLVSFSTNAFLELGLTAITSASKATLVGPPPGTSGLVGALAAGGVTTIGGGLQTAIGAFPPSSPSTNSRAILLLTDGLENTAPMIADVEGSLGPALLNIVGFGSEANLDGPRLTRLARDHRGVYTRANEGLSLKKFFALSFGNIFNLPTALDPEFSLADGVVLGPLVPFNVCGETMATVVLGWDNPHAPVELRLISPAGVTIASFSPGVDAVTGETWAHMRVPLPFSGERDGVWKVQVSRPSGGEIPPPRPAVRYFVTTLVEGGPYLRPLPMPPVYTGDILNPKVVLRYPSGEHFPANVTLEIESPTEGTGNILAKEKLGAAGSIDGDATDARTSKLMALENAKGSALISTTSRTITLFDDGEHDDEAIEEDGVFGNPIADLARLEGHYQFHAKAEYGNACIARREANWSVYVSVSIDPGNTGVSTVPSGTGPDGRERICITFTPRDKYGNYVGPGRGDSFTIAAADGSQLDGALTDNGDGSYVQCVLWDPDSGSPPGITIGQPGRPPVTIGEPPQELFIYAVSFLCGKQGDCENGCAPVRPGVYATEINIFNPHRVPVPVRKAIIPLVREPNVAKPRASDRIILPPHAATMDDCCRLGELLFGGLPPSQAPLTIGILELVSTQELSVTAVYSVTNEASGAVDLDVKQIKGLRRI